MPRSIWNGAISFGLITVPIKVHSATESQSIHFHQVHVSDGARIRQKRVCSKEHKDVPYKEVAKGYEVRSGEYVLLSQEEIDAAAGARSKTIELDEFVCAADIDPVFYNRTYYLGAGGTEAREGYRLLHDALARAARAGLGRWVFHNREYLVAVRASDDVLVLHTMTFADELVKPASLKLKGPDRAPTKREVEMAGALVQSLQDSFDPSAFKDTHRKRVLELIKRKAKGEDIELPEIEAPEPAPDLMEALEASLKGQKGRSKGSASQSKSKSGSTPRTKPKSKSRG